METSNYHLHQWSPEDQLLKTIYNGNLQKIDAALGELDLHTTESSRFLPRLAYNVYNLIVQNYYDGKVFLPFQNLHFDGFLNSDYIAQTTGGVHVSNQMLVLEGQGAIGTMLANVRWITTPYQRAFAWARGNGTLSISLDGQEMHLDSRRNTYTVQGEGCSEWTFSLDFQGGVHPNILLQMSCGAGSAMKIHDYGVYFL